VSWSAHLPIYDLPELRERNERLWNVVAEVIRDAGIPDVPDRLDGTGRPLFTQVCGLPLQTTERGRYALLGTPVYGVDGCAGTTHCAFIVVRRKTSYVQPADLRGTTFAINDLNSNTGMNLPRRLFARFAGGRAFFKGVTVSGSHAASAEHVANGSVDAAAIDCVTYAFLAEVRPLLVRQLRILARTDWSPAIPFVTAERSEDKIDLLRSALSRLSTDRRFTSVLRPLHIESIRFIGDRVYTMLRTYEADAAAAHYPVLR
jgi:ABC-type phosphate/phosphonate transport system substrate-binding protein